MRGLALVILERGPVLATGPVFPTDLAWPQGHRSQAAARHYCPVWAIAPVLMADAPALAKDDLVNAGIV